MINGGPNDLAGRPPILMWPVDDDDNRDAEGHLKWFCHFSNDGSYDRCHFESDPVSFLLAPSGDLGEEWLPEGFIAVCDTHITQGTESVDDAMQRVANMGGGT